MRKDKDQWRIVAIVVKHVIPNVSQGFPGGRRWFGVVARQPDFGQSKSRPMDRPFRLSLRGKEVSDPFCAKHLKGRFPAKGVGHFFLARFLINLKPFRERLRLAS